MMKSVFQKIKQNHFLVVVFCCAIPLIGIWALSSIGSLGSWGKYALLLVCPVGHLLMMRVMNHTQCMKAPQKVKEIEYKQ